MGDCTPVDGSAETVNNNVRHADVCTLAESRYARMLAKIFSIQTARFSHDSIFVTDDRIEGVNVMSIRVVRYQEYVDGLITLLNNMLTDANALTHE
jgi:hypothetical protein